MIVLVVLGLVLGIVVAHGPRRSPTLELRAAASQLAQGLRAARMASIASNRPVDLTLDVAARSFRIDGLAPHSLPPNLALSATVSGGQVAAGRLAGFAFAPDGSSSGGRITLADGARRAEVGVNWLTGRVSIDEP
ncbi:MAG: GspH/FimT family pseudopilin [Acidisphaera sp.]|nr:GspH/FimT family pseudopilin [Acidisphaera sp.]